MPLNLFTSTAIARVTGYFVKYALASFLAFAINTYIDSHLLSLLAFESTHLMIPKENRRFINRDSEQWRSQGRGERLPSLKPKKITLFIMIFYNSENSFRDLRPFCRPSFCHSSVVKYTSPLLQKRNRYETWQSPIIEIAPLTLLAGSAPNSGYFFVNFNWQKQKFSWM